MKKLSSSLLVLFFLLPVLHSENNSTGFVYSGSIIDVSEARVFRILNVDDPAFSQENLNDGHWPLIQVPENWKSSLFPNYNGAVWYRLTIFFPTIPNETPGIYLGQGVDLDETFFNGAKIGQNGSVKGNFNTTAYDVVRLYQIPTHLIHPGSNTLAIRVVNYYEEGGFMRGPFLLGPFENLVRSINLGNLIFLMMLAVYIYIAFITFLTALRDPKDQINWFFIGFVLSLCFYFFLRSQLKYEISSTYDFWKRLEYLSITAAATMFFFYLNFYLKAKFTSLDRILIFFSFISFFLVLVSFEPRFWHWVNTWVNQFIWAYFIMVTVLRLVKHVSIKKEDFPFLIGIVISFLSFISDLLVNQYLSLFQHLGFTGQFSFSAFVIVVSILRANRFEQLRRKASDLNKKLTEILEEKGKQLEDAQKRLANLQNSSSDISERLIGLMEEKKPYLDQELTLDSLAHKLGVNRNQVSFTLNQIIGKSFNDFINEYRVKEFLRLSRLQKNQDAKIITLAFDSGFSSKPTFNAVFKQIMGCPPSQYLKSL